MPMEEDAHSGLVIFNAYRPTTFYNVIAWLIGLAVIINVILAKDAVSLVLLVIPLWLYNYVQKKMKPLHDSRFNIAGKDLIIVFPRLPRIKNLSMGRLSIVHQVNESGEDIHVEFDEKSIVSYKLTKTNTVSIKSPGSSVYTGARIDPTYLTALFEEAYRLEYNDRTVYLGIIKPRNLKIVDNAGFDVSIDSNILKVRIEEELKPPITVKSYSKCCGFHSKKVLVGKIEESNTELIIKLGIPENPGIAIIPDKPYLPSLLGGIFSSLNYPVSYVSNHPESEFIVEIKDSSDKGGEIIIKPSK